ncbi:PD-(D/E)XK nuclease family transposase [Treponema sp. HNW]|uniref:PD-(D/E)XK nuclease family transposase n=1 Tax=Treponema sp. HNW TaxID=3116654 RepID=UPI003D0BF62F
MPHTFCTFQKTDNGLIVNIEMQQFWKSFIPRRNQLYLARTVAKNRTSCTIFSFKFRKRNLGIYSLCRPPWRYAKKETRYTFRY